MEPYKRNYVFKAFQYMSVGVLSVAALPPGSPHGACMKREAPFSKPSLTCLNVAFRVTSNGALPPGSSHRAVLETLLLQNALLLSLKVPGETSLPLGSTAGPLWREMLMSRAFLYISFRVTSKGAFPPGSFHRAPIERERDLFPEPSFIHASEIPGKQASPL
jgi:hypothetical protein